MVGNIKIKCDDGMDWIHLAQNTVQWRTLVDIVINAIVPKKAENF